MKKKIIIPLLIVAAASASYWINGYPFVIDSEKETCEVLNRHTQTGDTVAVFGSFDFSKDDWQLYIYCPKSEAKRFNNSNWICYRTSDRSQLLRLKEKMQFSQSGGDAATVVGKLVLYKNSQVVLKSGFSLDANVGIQSSCSGWLDAVDARSVTEEIGKMDKVLSPVVVL